MLYFLILDYSFKKTKITYFDFYLFIIFPPLLQSQLVK